MDKLEILQTIAEYGLVAVLRGDHPEQVVEMADQAIAGGIKIIEVTMTVPFALEAIELLAKKYDGAKGAGFQALIGAGTVLDPETARAAMLSGAAFIVSPTLNPDTVTICNRYRVPVLPGVMTMQEIQHALELGVDIMKLFPGSLYEPSIVKTIKGPLPQANLMPTGGVSLDNLQEWIRAGAVAVGIGSDLTADAVRSGDYSLVAKKASEYAAVYQAAKGL